MNTLSNNFNNRYFIPFNMDPDQISAEDYAPRFKIYYTTFSCVLYAIECMFFYFIIYLLLRSCSKILGDYSYYLGINFLTLHIFCSTKFFGLAKIRNKNFIFCSSVDYSNFLSYERLSLFFDRNGNVFRDQFAVRWLFLFDFVDKN